ncbi:MAG: anthrone oxygenase family protein [Pseudomonadota bacterium]
MTYEWTLYFCLFLALWSAVIGGVFSAFSEFIMSGLLRTSPACGIASMQHINRTVLKTQFVVGIFSIAIFSILFAVYSVAVFEGRALATIILAALVYLPSVFFMTMLGNVPMNDKLESLDHTSREAEVYWAQYGRDWTRLNHIRSIGSVLTSALYIAAAITLITSGQV